MDICRQDHMFWVQMENKWQTPTLQTLWNPPSWSLWYLYFYVLNAKPNYKNVKKYERNQLMPQQCFGKNVYHREKKKNLSHYHTHTQKEKKNSATKCTKCK